jgi:hypothetical protein
VLELDHDPDPAGGELEDLFKRRVFLLRPWPAVDDDKVAVRPRMHVELDVVGSDLDRASERCERVFGLVPGGSAVRDDEGRHVS